ncbi:MAG: tetratricopeptide repeat protein [Bacteroidia bacterium]|nr:tetratricopeptide repeat protein [Bacteroidia bacterium]
MYAIRLCAPLLALVWVTTITGCQSPPPAAEAAPAAVANTPEAQLRSLDNQIALNSRDYALYLDRSRLYYAMDSIPQALKDADQAVALFRDGPNVHYWRGFLAFATGDTVRAMEAYNRAELLGTDEAEVFYQRGQIFFFRGEYGKASRDYLAATELDSLQPIYVFAQGYLAEKQGDTKTALRKYLDALKIDTTFDKALARLHDVYLYQKGSPQEAMKYNQRLLEAHPLHPLGHFNLGSEYLRQALMMGGSAQENERRTLINQAVSEFTISVARDPNFDQAWYTRGYCYYLGEKLDEAMRDFEKTLSINPDFAQAHHMIGSIYAYSGDYRSALGYLRRAAELNPASRDFREKAEEVSALVQ